MRIVSLLPSATEILFALGLDEEIVGVSHECDFPLRAKTKTAVVSSRLPKEATPAETDRLVREHVERGESIYAVNRDRLEELAPDLIFTQDLCHVCAATPDDLSAALAHLERQPRVVTLNPHSLTDVCADIRAVGDATDRAAQAQVLIAEFERGIANVERTVAGRARPRVVCLEWLDPPYVAGHWVPEMVERAGGIDILGQAGKPSFRVEWEAVLAARPEVIVIMPCGYSLASADDEFRKLPLPDGWKDLPAVRNGRVFVVEASGYFSRPGPRLADGLAILANAIHSASKFRAPRTDAPPQFTRVASTGV